MSVCRPSVRFVSLLGALLLIPVFSGSALAQGQGNGGGNGNGNGNNGGGDDPIFEAMDTVDSIAPEVHIVPSSGTFADSMLDVTIYWCDDKDLDDDSRTIKHGFAGVVGNFSWESIVFAEPCNIFGDVYKSEGEINLADATTLSASIKDELGPHSANDNASYDYEPEIAPTVWTSPMNESYRNTAIEAAGGFEMVVAHATPGYVFKSKHRGLTFVYRSGQRHPTVLVQVKVSSGGAYPDEFSMKVKDPSGSFMTFVNTDSTELFWDGTQSTVMLGGVVDASSLGTGAHDLTVLVRSHFGGSWEETADTVRALVVDESSSPYGAGWSIAGIQRAHEQSDGSVLITEGDGSAVYFEENGASFTTPNGDFSTLTNHSGGFKRTYANGDEAIFDANGRMTKFTPHYYGLSGDDYTYETNGALATINPFSSGGIRTQLVQEGDSILVHEGEKNGVAPDIYRTTVIRLNGSGHMTSIEGPDGNDELSFGYTANRITQVTDRRGETTDFEYDELGYLASTELPQISVDGQGVRPTIEQQSLALTIGPDSTSGEGTAGNPATPVAVANVKPWVKDARGARTYFTLDPHGFRSAETIEEPLGRTTKVTRNNKAQVTRVDRPNGAYSTTSWSGPRMTGTFESTTGHTVLYEYASPPESNFNQAVRVHDNKGNRETWYQYDGNDHLSAVYHDSIGGPLLASYERTAGRLTSGTDSDTGHLVEYEYDFWFNYENVKAVHRIRGTDTLTTRFAYDDYGRRIKTVNPAGDSTFMAYDDLDRVLWSVNALGDTTRIDSYDGYLADTLMNARGKSRTSTYNAIGWVTQSVDPELEASTIGYDKNGNVVSAIDRLEKEATFGYDSLNLPIFEEVEGDTVHIWIDPDGLKSAVENAASIDTTVFDTSGRPIKQIIRRGSGFTRRYVIESAYDDDGPRNRVWASTPGSVDYDMRYVWNNQGQLTKLSDYVPATPVHAEFGYNAHHQLDSISIGGAKRWSYDHAEFHSVVRVIYENNLNQHLGYSVNMDSLLLRIAQMTWAGGDTTRSLEYDAQSQIKTVADSAFSDPTCEWHDNYGELCYGGGGSEVAEQTFTYDAVGNRTDQSAVVTDGDRLTDFGSYDFTYDDEGRTRTKAKTGFAQTYYWNDRSQLDSVSTTISGNTTVVHYTYDGLGRRITRDGPGGFEEYLYDGDHVIVVMDDNQTVLRTFSYYPGVDKPHSVMTDTATYYYATDPTGSVSGLAEYDGTASVVNHYRYDVWGMPQGTVTEGVDNPIRFKARWWDENTELLDFRNRWYDPEIGRFISEDPIGIAGGINVYRFVGNNPVSGWDPYGLFDPCPFPAAAESIPIIGPTIEMFNDITSLAQTGFPCGVELEPIQVEGSSGGGVYLDGPSGGLLLPGGNMSAPGGGGGNPSQETAACVALSADEQRIVNRNIRAIRTAHSYSPWTASAVWYYNVHPANEPFKVIGLGTIGFVRGHGRWDYKNHGGTHAFGNIHYGATGSAAGIMPSTLVWGSNQAQLKIQTGTPDNAQDRGLVMQGVQYYQNGCWR